MTDTHQTIEPWLRAILRCPKCKGELTDGSGPKGEQLNCAACSLAYDIDGGVPVLLVDLAHPLQG